MRGKRYVALLVVVLVGLLAVVLASPMASATQTRAAADVAHAQAALKGLSNLPKWKAPGPAFNARKVMKGKAILSIPGSGTDPFYVQIENAMKAAAAAVGYKFSTWNNQGQMAQYQQGIQNGIARKVAVIDLLAGPDPNALKPQIDAAKAAHVLVVSSHLSAFEQKVPNVSANLPQDYTRAGRLLADWVITKDTKAHVLVLISQEIVSTAAVVNGITSEFNKYGGPDIKFTFVNVPVPDWGTKIQPTVQSAIVADPQLTYVISIYDSMSQFVVPAIAATSSASRVHAIGFNNTPFVLDLVRQGKIEMDFGDMLNWAGWAIADAEMRLIAHMPVLEKPGHFLNNPFRLFTIANVKEAGVPASFLKGYGSYIPQYKKLWGIK
jgi:ribose transport system substrate-binding protein